MKELFVREARGSSTCEQRDKRQSNNGTQEPDKPQGDRLACPISGTVWIVNSFLKGLKRRLVGVVSENGK